MCVRERECVCECASVAVPGNSPKAVPFVDPAVGFRSWGSEFELQGLGFRV